MRSLAAAEDPGIGFVRSFTSRLASFVKVFTRKVFIGRWGTSCRARRASSLTPRAVVQLRRLGIDIDDPRFERHEGLRIYSRRVTLELPWPDLEAFPNFGLMLTRAEFDELLARHAEKAGARLMERTEAVAPTQQDGWVTGARIRGEDDRETTVRARFVIAADGASSRFASQAGVRRDPAKPLGIAARRYYRIERRPGPWLEVWMDLREGDDTILPGYGWLFPLSDGSVNVGAGLLNTFRDFKDL